MKHFKGNLFSIISITYCSYCRRFEEKARLLLVFQPTSPYVFAYPDKPLFLVLDILLFKRSVT